MSKILIMIFLTSCFLCRGDALDVMAMHSNMVYRLSMSDSSFSVDYTNNLVHYANNTVVAEKASVLTALGIAMFDRFDTTGDISALDNCALICSNVVHDSVIAGDLWQKAAASIVYASVFAQDGKYAEAFAVCTNAINRNYSEPISVDDRLLWSAICRHQSSCALSVADALRFYSAMALLMNDVNSSCFFYTNALPQDAMLKIRRIIDSPQEGKVR